MELVELMRGAQEAMDRGDYRLAAAACSHALDAYPSCLAAERMLGEAFLEQGDSARAAQHFERTLSLDPLNVVARLGLGVAAEENKDLGKAYACYLHAWEINSALDQVRDELVRLRGALGSDERLHPTRAGLASIYARGGQYARSVSEWRAVVAGEPDSRRARTSLAEVLWRSGDDGAAALAGREALRSCTENARALAILADIEKRKGSPTAIEFADRYHAVDPVGEVVTLLAEWREDVDLSFLRGESAPVTDFDFSATSMPERDYLAAPAPQANGLAAQSMAAPDLWDTIVKDLQSDPKANPDLAMSAGAGADVDPGVVPFSWSDDGAGNQPSQAAQAWEAPPPAPAPVTPETLEESVAAMAAPVAVAASLADASGHERDVAPILLAGAATVALHHEHEQRHEAEVAAVAAAAVAPVVFAERQPAEPVPDPFITADGRVDLTVGWDDLDRTLKEATPSFDVPSADLDLLVAELGVDGIAPFEVDDNSFDDGAWAPFTADDLGAQPTPVPAASLASHFPPDPALDAAPPVDPIAAFIGHVEEPPSMAAGTDLDESPFGGDADAAAADAAIADIVAAPVTGAVLAEIAVAPLTEADLAGIGAEPFMGDEPWAMGDDVLTGIPQQGSSGYTDLLRHIDLEEPAPFVENGGPDPFANPDAAGNPLAFEELLAVTSQDGTAQLGADPESQSVPAPLPEDLVLGMGQAPIAEPITDPDPVLAADGFDAVLAGLDDVRPFSFDEMSRDGSVSGEVMDFSEINDDQFDPTKFAAPAVAAAWAIEAEQEAPIPALEIVAEAGTESPAWPAATEPSAETVAPTAASILATPEAEPPARPSAVWPGFVNHTSALMDREKPGENVFSRLRSAKRAADPQTFHVERRPAAPAKPASNGTLNGARNGHAAAPVATIERSESWRDDLMAMRIRLIEEDDSAEEIVAAVEALAVQGVNDPLASRVLGEAYLKLGRNEQAAAQFRQAMLARRRGR